MQRFLLLFLLLLPSALIAQTPSENRGSKPSANGVIVTPPVKTAATRPGLTVTTEQWARPRSGEAVAGLPGLARLVAMLDQDSSHQLVIHYAGGDEGTLWAEELRSWLVALGVSSADIRLEAGHPQTDTLQLELLRPGAQ